MVPMARPRGGDTLPLRPIVADPQSLQSGPAIRRRFACFGLFGLGQEKIPGTPQSIRSQGKISERDVPADRTPHRFPFGGAPPPRGRNGNGHSSRRNGNRGGRPSRSDRRSPPPAGKDPFEKAHPGVMPFDADVPVLQAPLKIPAGRRSLRCRSGAATGRGCGAWERRSKG